MCKSVLTSIEQTYPYAEDCCRFVESTIRLIKALEDCERRRSFGNPKFPLALSLHDLTFAVRSNLTDWESEISEEANDYENGGTKHDDDAVKTTARP